MREKRESNREREKKVSKFIPFLFKLKDGIARKKCRKKKFLSILGVDDRHGESQAKAKLWRAERLLIRMQSKKNKTRKASICRRLSERQKGVNNL